MKLNRVINNVRLFTVIIFLMIIIALANAQITITSSEIPQTVGSSFTYKYCTATAPISVGQPGGPQVWNFDTTTYEGGLTILSIVDLNSTPFNTIFPDANVVHRSGEPGDSTVSFGFQTLTNDEFVRLGYGYQSIDTISWTLYDPTELVSPLPLNYGDSWWTEFGFTIEAGPIVCISKTWGTASADAYGTVNTPAGSFPCLRINTYDTTTTETYIGGNLINTDTVGYRVYIWCAENVGNVVYATGPENDTSFIFTETNCYRVMVEANTGISEEKASLHAKTALSVVPNPCSERAMLNLNLGRPGPVMVKLFDNCGNLVKRFNSSADINGHCTLVWNRSDESGNRVTPGVYFCTVTGRDVVAKIIVTK